MTKPEQDKTAERFAVFRHATAPDLEQSGILVRTPDSATAAPAVPEMRDAIDAGYGHAHHLRVLYAANGFSLVHAWYKSGFPLPRHSHEVDCVYYVMGGSLRIGTETLNAGDGFFVGADVPYAYTAGEAGVEVLEFRAVDSFGLRMLANNPAFWSKAAEKARAKQAVWPEETVSPSGVVRTDA